MIEKRRYAARVTANTLSLSRITTGPYIANKLRTTPPAERTWEDSATTAAFGATDFLDGVLGRYAGSTTFGKRSDEIADKLFVLLNQATLAKNGELPPVHFFLKLARDVSISAMRQVAQKRGEEIPAGKRGKIKTSIELSMLATASSPLSSSHPDIIRGQASWATSLSLTSGAAYVAKFLQKTPSDKDVTITNGRNSKVRNAASKPIDRIVTTIDQKFPEISADHLTLAGAAMVLTAGTLLVKKPERKILATSLYAAGSLMDGLDGSLARKKKSHTNEKPSQAGAIKDLLADKTQEVATLLALSSIARQRGNVVAANNYALAAVTTPFGALFRATSEVRGQIVAEGGLGTRVGRGILGGIGLTVADNTNMSDIISATVAAANVSTIQERAAVTMRGSTSPDSLGQADWETIEAARSKLALLVPFSLATCALVANTFVRQDSEGKHRA